MRNYKISVAMATYNGEKYIREQMSSIINQLEPMDEIVVSDDYSKDATIEIIKGFKDDRIKIVYNDQKGVVNNFENALKQTTGSIVFLADQDDVWSEDKVFTIIHEFEKDVNTTLVFSNALIIDKQGEATGNFFFDGEPSTSLFNLLIKNHFLGCTIAFKKEKVKVVPFPKTLPMHDWWIGLRHVLAGKVVFINKPLIYYRRHGSNVTTGKRANILQVIKWRVEIIKALVFNE